MANALILTAPAAMTAPLPGTPKLLMPGDRVVLTSDGFSGSSEPLGGRLTDANAGGTPMPWQATSAAPGLKTNGAGAAVPDAETGSYFYHFTVAATGSRAMEIGVKVNALATLYIDLFRDTTAVLSQKMRATIRSSGACSLVYSDSAGNVDVPGGAFTAAAGDTVRFGYNTKTRKATVYVNGAAVVDVTFTPPAALTGQLFGLAGTLPAAVSLDNFTLTESII